MKMIVMITKIIDGLPQKQNWKQRWIFVKVEPATDIHCYSDPQGGEYSNLQSVQFKMKLNLNKFKLN